MIGEGGKKFTMNNRSRQKRGTDHNWQTRKYSGDAAIYAHCKCGFEYNCSSSKRTEDGTWSIKQYITKLYLYCPRCGARKKWYNEEPIKLKRNN